MIFGSLSGSLTYKWLKSQEKKNGSENTWWFKNIFQILLQSYKINSQTQEIQRPKQNEYKENYTLTQSQTDENYIDRKKCNQSFWKKIHLWE